MSAHDRRDSWWSLLSEGRQLHVNERLLQALCVSVAIAILPFAAYRMLIGDWLVGAVDALLVCLLIGGVVYFGRSARPERAGWVLAPLYCAGALALYTLQQAAHAYWLFPAVAANFVLLPVRAALVGTALMLGAVALVHGLWLHTADATLLLSLLVALALLATICFAFVLEVLRGQRMLSGLVSSDPLTGAGNRRALDEALREAAEALSRHGRRATLLLFDLDHFKRVNDQCGHKAGDQVLVRLAELVGRRKRLTDRLYRFGGEEFVMLLPDTLLTEGVSLAEALRREFACHLHSPIGPVSASFGGAELQPAEDPYEWLARADRAMYRAKDRGRDRVEADLGERDTLALHRAARLAAKGARRA